MTSTNYSGDQDVQWNVFRWYGNRRNSGALRPLAATRLILRAVASRSPVSAMNLVAKLLVSIDDILALHSGGTHEIPGVQDVDLGADKGQRCYRTASFLPEETDYRCTSQ
jgi:hypothetical protein